MSFVKGLTNGRNPALHRLLLLDFDRTMLPLTPGALGLDTTCSIPHASVMTFVRSLIDSSGAAVNAQALEAEIMDGLSDPVQDLPELNTRLVQLMEAVQ